MPVTLKINPNRVGSIAEDTVKSSDDLFQRFFFPALYAGDPTSSQEAAEKFEAYRNDIYLHSFGDLDTLNPPHVLASPAGFVGAVLDAFYKEVHLVLRPDDVWLAILTQFNFYVNKHADTLRNKFMCQDAPEPIEVDIRQNFTDKELGPVATRITQALKGTVDPKVMDWLMPAFSTTNLADRWVAMVIMCGTINSYMQDIPIGKCGFPTVKLEGKRKDWVDLLAKVKRLSTGGFGPEVDEWAEHLVIVATYMLATWDHPNSQDVASFWDLACDLGGTGENNSQRTLGGWITSFCFWDSDGNRVTDYTAEQVEAFCAQDGDSRLEISFGGKRFPVIPGEGAIPNGYSHVDIMVEDKECQHDMKVIAGFMGVTATKHSRKEDLNTVQPRTGYWMLNMDHRPIIKIPQTEFF